MNPVKLEAWLAAHRYLQPLADFTARVEDVVAEIQTTHPHIPRWEDYAEDYNAGLPLLQSANAGVDLEPAGRVSAELVARLAVNSPAGRPKAEASLLNDELRLEGEPSRRIADWLLGDESFLPSAPGLLRYLGWTAAARYLMPLVDAFDRWRGEDSWLRSYCPTCGSLPAMAQLIGAETARIRWLSCGLCRSRWRFARTLCMFCGNDFHRAAAITIQGEAGLRVDHCPSCKGYLKTYDGQGNEDVMLADWTTLHLDVAAHDRGLVRKAASLYELGALLPARLETGDR